MTIDELFPQGKLRKAVESGLVTERCHPSLPFSIYNYSPQVQFGNLWDEVTLACRGLIVSNDGTLIARPFRKFFNHRQPGGSVISESSPVHVTDKLDGSLGILFDSGDGYEIATRGSFESDQAKHATELYRSEYHRKFTPPQGVTLLFEIIYPENRIVVDYGAEDDLYLLGGVEMATGRVIGPERIQWPGKKATTFSVSTFGDALSMPPRENAEGIVVRCLKSGAMVKLKQEDYVNLHRIVTGLNARAVWQAMVDGKSINDLVADLPDEFHGFARDTAARICADVDDRRGRAYEEYNRVIASLPNGFSRRDFAEAAKGYPDAWALFSILDGRDPGRKMLLDMKPEAGTKIGGW